MFYFFPVAPTITDPPLETVLTVNEGMPATFECTATGIPGPDITWRRDSDSSEFNSTLDSRVTLGMQTTPVPVSTSVGTIFSVSRQLTLSNTEDSDSGLYFCQASNGEADNLNVDVPFVLFVRGVSHTLPCTFQTVDYNIHSFSSCTSNHGSSRRQDRNPGRLCSVYLQCHC